MRQYGLFAGGGAESGRSLQYGGNEHRLDSEQAQLPFVLIAPSIELAMALPGEPDRFGSLPNRGQPEVRARVGDLVQVTIFESASGGLFTAPQAANNSGGGGNFVNLPPQPVDVNGQISVPYAGSIRVAGRPLSAVQAGHRGEASLAGDRTAGDRHHSGRTRLDGNRAGHGQDGRPLPDPQHTDPRPRCDCAGRRTRAVAPAGI